MQAYKQHSKQASVHSLIMKEMWWT